MQAIIRLKRPLEVEPLDTLILNCNKRRKLDEETQEISEPELAVLKFSGTQSSQDEDVTSHVATLKRVLKDNLISGFKKHNTDIIKKLRLEALDKTRNNRYKVVNCLRSNLPTNSDNDLTVYDLELAQEADTSNQKFAYDLYYSDTKILEELDGYDISIYPTSDNLVFDSDDVYNADEENNDSEDSNAENNWRNDYPDESDEESIHESDIVNAVKNLDIDDTLSSEDEFAYCVENDEKYFQGIDELEEKKYGNKYAKFIAENKDSSDSQEENSLSMSDLSENDYYL